MLERQKKFFGKGSAEMDAYKKRELELQELKELEDKVQAEAKARIQAEAELAQFKADSDAEKAKLLAEIERLKAGQKS